MGVEATRLGDEWREGKGTEGPVEGWWGGRWYLGTGEDGHVGQRGQIYRLGRQWLDHVDIYLCRHCSLPVYSVVYYSPTCAQWAGSPATHLAT